MARFAPDTVADLSAKAWTVKDQIAPHLRDCYEYAMPEKNPYYGTGSGQPQGSAKQQGGDRASRKVFDSTLIADTARLVNRIQYELFPIGARWANFVPGAFVGDDQKEAARSSLHMLQEVVFAAIQFSNFDLAIAEWLLELVVAGTACMMVADDGDDDPVLFIPVTQAHVALREGAFGRIDLISRKHKMRFSLVAETWRDANMGGLEAPKKGADPEIDLIDVTYWSGQDRVWYYDVIVTGGLKDKDAKRIVERKFDLCPWIVTRWWKAAEEVHGRSIVSQALPDARVLSAVKSYILRNAALAVGGVFLARNDGTVNPNTVKIFPGAVIPVKATGGPAGASIAPLQVGGDLQLANIIIQDLVTAIHKIMLNDGAPEIRDGVRSATEWLERMKQLQQSLGAPFARILREGIVPMLEMVVYHLAKRGIIQGIEPGRALKLNDGNVQIQFASPLVSGQALREVEAARDAATLTREIAGPTKGDEAVALSFKVEDIGAWIGERLGVVPKVMRTKPERDDMQKKMGAMIAANMNGGAVPQVGGQGGANLAAPGNQQRQAA